MGSKEGETTDQSSPRSVLEIVISGVDSDTSSIDSNTNDISIISSDGSTAQDALVSESYGLQWRNLISVLKKKSMRRLLTSPPLMSSDQISRRNLSRNLARIRYTDDHDDGAALIQKPSWRSFDREELAAATNNFSSENLIGRGGHAEVYKGCLPDGHPVAVKRLINRDNEEERVNDFLSELGIIAHIDHPNAARLLGFGVEGGLHLILQFSPHGSLASLLHGSKESLAWKIRFKVALGVAQGLLYLHKACHRRIIHRDIKASNILLTHDYEPQISDFEPFVESPKSAIWVSDYRFPKKRLTWAGSLLTQISDFGLAKWLPDQWTQHIVYPIEGTFGYLAPEYFMHGIVDEKTDVFAFGVLLLELITGRRAIDSRRQSLVMWAKPLLDKKNMKELHDPRLGDTYDPSEMKRAMVAASMCIHHISAMRPHMNRIVQVLNGEDATIEMMGREAKLVVGKTVLVDACDLEDYTCSTYLNDLNRHRQLALE